MMKSQIFFIIFCINILNISLAQREEKMCVSYIYDVLDKKKINKNMTNCNELYTIVNYNENDPELCHAQIFFNDSKIIELDGTICYCRKDTFNILICVQKLPCCGGNMISYSWYYLDDKNHTISDMICKISFTTETTIPPTIYYDTIINYHTLPKDYLLRASPSQDDSTEYYDLRQSGNVVAFLEKGAKYYTFAEQDNLRDQWYFVIVKVDKFIKDAFKNSDDTFICGWVLFDE